MKETGIFIDFRNEEQVKWWNEKASKLVKVTGYRVIVETATNKPVGCLINFKGLFKNYVIKKNLKFIKNPVKKVFED